MKVQIRLVLGDYGWTGIVEHDGNRVYQTLGQFHEITDAVNDCLEWRYWNE